MHAAILPGSGSPTHFLFSKELLRQLGCVLDMQEDVCYCYRLSEAPIKLRRAARGHYAISVILKTDLAVEAMSSQLRLCELMEDLAQQ